MKKEKKIARIDEQDKLPVGRPKNSVAKKTKLLREITAKALFEGANPLEVLLKNMRYYDSKAEGLLAEAEASLKKGEKSEHVLELLVELSGHRKMAGYFAAEAAPYCHAKLNNITLDGNVTHKVEEADAAYKTIEGTLEQIVDATTVGVGFQSEVDSAGETKSTDPREFEPKDQGRKLVHLVDARRTRVG